jgi:hypothetical protein
MSAEWSAERFQSQVAELREEVKEELFSSASRLEPEPAADSEDAILAGILANLLKKWGASEQPVESPPPPASPQQDEAKPSLSELETLPLEFAEGVSEDWGPETVILSSAGTEAKTATTAAGLMKEEVEAPAARVSAAASDQSPDETLVLTAKDKEADEEEVLPETVILPPESRSKGQMVSPPRQDLTSALQDSTGTPGDLEPSEGEEKQPSKEADELLMETVILSPKKDKD